MATPYSSYFRPQGGLPLSKKNLKSFGGNFFTVAGNGISNGLSNIFNDGADFGPDTKGTTTSGINEAISAVKATSLINSNAGATSWLGGGTVWMLPHNFNIKSSVTIKASEVSLIGSGWSTTIVCPNSFNTDAIVCGDGSNTYRDILLKDFKIFGNGTNLSPGNNTSGNGINWNVNIERSRIENVFPYTMGGAGVYLNETSDNAIVGCYAENNGTVGFVLTGGGDNSIIDCEGDTNGNYAFQVYDEIGDNFNGCTTFGNIQYGFYAQGMTMSTVTGCRFMNDGQGSNLSYPEIGIDSDGGSNYSTNNTFVGNMVKWDSSVSSNKPTYAFQEYSASDDYNIYAGNSIVGMGTSNYKILGTHSLCYDVAIPKVLAPTDPSGTTSASGVMMGLGSTLSFTPVATGRVRVRIHGQGQTATGLTTLTITPKYGTGGAPSNGGAVTGTTWDIARILEGGAIGQGTTVYLEDEITGATPGTALWFDVELATGNASDSASLSKIKAIIEEVLHI